MSDPWWHAYVGKRARGESILDPDKWHEGILDLPRIGGFRSDPVITFDDPETGYRRRPYVRAETLIIDFAVAPATTTAPLKITAPAPPPPRANEPPEMLPSQWHQYHAEPRPLATFAERLGAPRSRTHLLTEKKDP